MSKDYLIRVEIFNTAHKLWVKTWTAEENQTFFGKCAIRNWHGHNRTLEVTIIGSQDPVTCFLIHAKTLSKIIITEVFDHLGQMNLNMDVPFLKDLQLTTDNLVFVFWEKLKDKIPGRRLHKGNLLETEKIFAE